jgi:hypothetical protein
MKYKFDKFITYMFKKRKKTLILKATDILAVQMLKFIGSFYWLYKSTVHVHKFIKFIFHTFVCYSYIFFVFILKADEKWWIIHIASSVMLQNVENVMNKSNIF